MSGADSESSAERFRLTTLQGRFNALCERWDRLQGEKEAGRRPGIYSHFTRVGAGDFERPPARPNAEKPASVEEEEESPRGDPAADRELYERYRQARIAHGEDVAGLDLDRFVERLTRERERLRQHFGATEIEFVVAEREGRIRLVARPKESNV